MRQIKMETHIKLMGYGKNNSKGDLYSDKHISRKKKHPKTFSPSAFTLYS